jgi:hypothetical protein
VEAGAGAFRRYVRMRITKPQADPVLRAGFCRKMSGALFNGRRPIQ